MTEPTTFEWTGEEMKPLRRHVLKANEQYVVGETYTMEEVSTRSKSSHDHFFATVADMWQTLPERYDGDFATAEHLRKFALIRTGYHNRTELVCPSNSAALKASAFVQAIDEFAIVEVRGCCVTRYTARTQKMRAMGKAEFQASKDAVLSYIDGLLRDEVAA